MTLRHGNRIRETTATVGTGTLDLAGAVTGYQAISGLAGIVSGDTVRYVIVDNPDSPTSWEVGRGTWTSGAPSTLSRDTVEESSNADAKVSWAAGTKTVSVTQTAAGMPDLLIANVWLADQTLRSDDAGAASGPILDLFRNSASPAVNDQLGQLRFTGKDSAGNTEICATISAQWNDPTNASEDTAFTFDTYVAGVRATRVTVAAGMVVGGATGGDKGAGTINVSADIYKNNTAYANPDYVFEHYYTGRIEMFAGNPGARDYTGLKPLAELETYVRAHYHLPGAHEQRGAFERSDFLLATIEELHLRLFELDRRLAALQAALQP